MGSLAYHNAFVFNYIENNEKDIARLEECFYSRNVLCPVQVYQHPSYEELNKIVDQIVAMNFILFNYIVVVVLDNTNPCDFLLTAKADGRHFNVNADLLRRIGNNDSLRLKPRLVVWQINRNFDKQKVYREPHTGEGYLHRGTSNDIHATCLSKALTNHWSREGSNGESPFVRAFCENFQKNSSETFKKLSDGIIRDMAPYGEIPEITIQKSTHVYGPGLDEQLIKGYFNRNERLTRYLQ